MLFVTKNETVTRKVTVSFLVTFSDCPTDVSERGKKYVSRPTFGLIEMIFLKQCPTTSDFPNFETVTFLSGIGQIIGELAGGLEAVPGRVPAITMELG